MNSPTVDYGATIRAELERDVEKLLRRVNLTAPSNAAKRVVVGYTAAMHRGRDVVKTGDMLAGLPVVVSREANREVSVVARTRARNGAWHEVSDSIRW